MAITRLCTLLLTTLSITINSTLCCDCDDFMEFRCKFCYTTINSYNIIMLDIVNLLSDTNISLEGSVRFRMRIDYIDIYDCLGVEAHWEIQRADGNIEVYTVLLNDTYLDQYLPDRGLNIFGNCDFRCRLYLDISPTDLRYNGAQITGVFNLPECFNSSNVTDTITLNIQGIYQESKNGSFYIMCVISDRPTGGSIRCAV